MAIITLWGYGHNGYEYYDDYKYDKDKEGQMIFDRNPAFDKIFNETDSITNAMTFYGMDLDNYVIDQYKKDGGYNVYEKDSGKEFLFAEVRYGSAAPCLEPLRRREIDSVLDSYRNNITSTSLVLTDDPSKEIRVASDSCEYFYGDKDYWDETYLRECMLNWGKLERMLRDSAREGSQQVRFTTKEHLPKGKTVLSIEYSQNADRFLEAPGEMVVDWSKKELSKLTDKWLSTELVCTTCDDKTISAKDYFGDKLAEINDRYEKTLNEWQEKEEQDKGQFIEFVEKTLGPQYEIVFFQNGCEDAIGFEKIPLPEEEYSPPAIEMEKGEEPPLPFVDKDSDWLENEITADRLEEEKELEELEEAWTELFYFS